MAVALSGCTTLPKQEHVHYKFPKDQASITIPKREHEVIGVVRDKVDYTSLDMDTDEETLCRIYFNKSVANLVSQAEKKGADYVIDVKSVVFYPDGKWEAHPGPECADDGMTGQVLTRGTAVKWKPDPPEKEE